MDPGLAAKNATSGYKLVHDLLKHRTFAGQTLLSHLLAMPWQCRFSDSHPFPVQAIDLNLGQQHLVNCSGTGELLHGTDDA